MTPRPVSRLVAALVLTMAFSASAPAQNRVDEDLRAVPDQVAPQIADPRRTGQSSVRVSASTDGRTPNLIGYNMGVHTPGNNVSAWVRYNEINAARHWWSQKSWPALPAVWPDAENTLAHFEGERTALRADAADGLAALAAAIVADQGTPPAGTFGLQHSLSELRKNGATVLIQLNQNTRTYPFERADGSPDWHGRWTYWRGVYLNARYLASTYDVERFQLFNEPDHPSSKHITQTDYLRRHQLGADALHAALADVNRAEGKTLALRLGAPASAGMLVFEKRSGRPDTRDLDTGWGELITRNRRDTFPGRGEAFGSLYNVYSFQNYGRDPDRMLNGIPRLRALVAAGNGGQELPLIVTEMNVSTAANFNKTAETLDSPSYYAPFGAVAAAYVNAGIDEIYVFRHTQEPLSGGTVKKNGTHLVGLSDPLQNIVASTRGAEVARLLARGFQGARPRFTPPTLGGGLLHAAAALNESDRTHHLLLTHLDPQAETIPVDLSAWNLPAGSLVLTEEVSETHHGDLRAALPLPADGLLALPVSGSSVTLLSLRPALSGTPLSTHPVSANSQQGLLSAAALPEAGSAVRVLLALRAEPVVAGGRLQVRAGAGNPVQADVLGQFIATADAAERVVDVTRHVLAHPNTPLVFQVVAEGSAASLANEMPAPAVVRSAELRIYGPR